MNRLLPLMGTLLMAITVSTPATGGGSLGAEIVFTNSEVTAIRAWYRDHPESYHISGGKKGRYGLPPGIAKKLARGKPLPPGIAKQVLPGGLVHELPPVRPGYERVIVDGRVLLVEVATQIVHDILTDVIVH